MKRTPSFSNYMLVVKRVIPVLPVNDLKLLLNSIYVAIEVFFSYLTPCLIILQYQYSEIRCTEVVA